MENVQNMIGWTSFAFTQVSPVRGYVDPVNNVFSLVFPVKSLKWLHDNWFMRWRNPMPKLDFSKNHAVVKLLALALMMCPAILVAASWVLKALR